MTGVSPGGGEDHALRWGMPEDRALSVIIPRKYSLRISAKKPLGSEISSHRDDFPNAGVGEEVVFTQEIDLRPPYYRDLGTSQSDTYLSNVRLSSSLRFQPIDSSEEMVGLSRALLSLSR